MRWQGLACLPEPAERTLTGHSRRRGGRDWPALTGSRVAPQIGKSPNQVTVAPIKTINPVIAVMTKQRSRMSMGLYLPIDGQIALSDSA
jgi:hypothetical protein